MNNGYTDMSTMSQYGQAPPMQAQQPSVYRPPSVQQMQQQESPIRSNVATPEPPKSKGPVPEEHMYLQTVFDELKNQCSCAANNPVSLFLNGSTFGLIVMVHNLTISYCQIIKHFIYKSKFSGKQKTILF